ncbi:alpha/beta hydrolase [Agriterribacter sp.]|uniref:alpha/beta hydrolase n=1 Tax=Agriterribacter sp. TaxID=2821509 RepID=UPI002CDB40C0|nr:alpha/beta hydrolase [Agriterribacter sp.]HRP58163.1 alpha/beta hydrolase [Agriterribacter sp.]
MHRLLIGGCILTCTTLTLYGQQLPPARYKDRVFTAVTTDKNIIYQSNPPAGTKEKYYLLDLYQPENDTSTSRPLIIWIHGGGFKFGNKTSRGIPLWCKRFAQRGYVCAAVNYRLSKEPALSNFTALVNACSDAMEDIDQAVSFFIKNSNVYRIDTSRIILAGNSAGGMIALHLAYSNAVLMKQLVQPGADPGLVAAIPERRDIAAVINFWGGMFDTGWLKNASVPIVSVHGGKDRIVPFGKTDNGVYGSLVIHQNADALHIPNRLKAYEGYAHELQKRFNPFWAGKATKVRWQEAGQFAADFLYEELMGMVQ